MLLKGHKVTFHVVYEGVVIAHNGRLTLAITTVRDVEQGEELTFDYNAVTESINEYMSAVCLCGHVKCRGSFLHFATADCYQQVLERNFPVAVRLAALIRSCTKKVMSPEDASILSKHGFGTAAFGAVSYHLDRKTQQQTDGMSHVPVWLRTFVADTLRYIEYERRALPIALVCDQFVSKRKVTKDAVAGKGKNTKEGSKRVRQPMDLQKQKQKQKKFPLWHRRSLLLCWIGQRKRQCNKRRQLWETRCM